MALPTCTAPVTREGKELTGTEITQETLRLALQRCTNVRTRQSWHSGAGVRAHEDTGHRSARRATAFRRQRKNKSCPQTEPSQVRARGILFTV